MSQERTGLQADLGGERAAEEEGAQGKTGVCGTEPRDQEPSGPASRGCASRWAARTHLEVSPPQSLTQFLSHTHAYTHAHFL